MFFLTYYQRNVSLERTTKIYETTPSCVVTIYRSTSYRNKFQNVKRETMRKFVTNYFVLLECTLYLSNVACISWYNDLEINVVMTLDLYTIPFKL